MTFQKFPNQLPQESMLAVESRGNIRNVLEMIAHDGSVNKQANLYDFKALYKEKRFDLEAEFAKRPETRKREKIVGEFIHDIKHGAPSELAEMLPLLANQPGRLGDYIEAHVTKTARPDDQGNSFIDIVVEIKNTFLATEQASREMKDVKTKMTFLVDITAATGQSFNVKLLVLH